MKKMLIIIGIFFVVFLIFYITNIIKYDTFKGKEQEADIINLALEKAGIETRSWQTMIIGASREVQIPPEAIWDAWSQLENWPNWSSGLHQSTRWLADTRWQPGSEFEQVLDLGFPVGKITSVEKIGEVKPGKRIIWWKQESGMKTCHIWQFDELTNGNTRISNIEVFHGTTIALLKPFVIEKWQRKFEAGLDGFIQHANAIVAEKKF